MSDTVAGVEATPPVVSFSNPRRTHREDKLLAVPLEPHEKIEHGEAIANLMLKVNDADSELAGAKTRHKDEVGTLELQIAEHARTLRRGSVDREIECEVEMDFEHGRVSYTRLDTGHVYHERAMTYQERQQELKLTP